MRLQYGCANADPKRPILAAWGARLLWDEVVSGQLGIVGDRVDSHGPAAHRTDLIDVMNQWAGDKMKERISELVDTGEWTASSRQQEKLVDQDRVVIFGDPQGSWGYLYVTAFLVGEESIERRTLQEIVNLVYALDGQPEADRDTLAVTLHAVRQRAEQVLGE